MADSDGPTRDGSLGIRVLIGTAVLVNLILTVLLIQQVREARSEFAEVRGELATRRDVAMLHPVRVRETLERRCTSCHTDRRFAKALELGPRELEATVLRMNSHLDGAIPAQELVEIQAAMLVWRCTSCHDDAVLSKIVLMPRAKRRIFLRGKLRMPGSGLSPDRLGELMDAFDVLLRTS